MKRLKINVYFSVLVSVLTLITACSKNIEPSNKSQDKRLLTAAQIGSLHNRALAYVEQNGSVQTGDINDLSIYEAKLLSEFLKKEQLSAVSSDKDILRGISIVNNNYRNEMKKSNSTLLRSASISATLFSIASDSIKIMLTELGQTNKLTETESEFIATILTKVEVIENIGDYSKYPELIKQAKNEWTNLSFNEIENEGYLSLIFISILENSYEYWNGNLLNTRSTNSISSTELVPLWVALDAVGALAGGGSSLFSQRNNTNIDWWEVGGQAAIWGIAGSIPGTRIFKKIL